MSTSAILIDYNQYINNRLKKFHYVSDIKYTLKHYNLNTNGKKKELIERLDIFFNSIKNMNKYSKQIIIIQKYIRGYLTRRKLLNKDYYFRYSKCNNKEDFYTFESINDIKELYFFSYTDKDNFTYFFDIRSFEKLKNGSHSNPYNRQPIPSYAIESYNKRLEMVLKNKQFKPFDKPILSDEQKYRNYVIEVFQKIDNTECIAGGTNINWFINLSFSSKINFYKILEDIWIYRANLTNNQKDLIVPDRNIFNRNNYEHLYKNKNKPKFKKLIEYFILKNMEKLVSSATENCHRVSGAYYILIALVEVSTECANSLPWLIQ